MDIPRLRNLTTKRLHTEMGHVYEDLEYITGQKGLMTHMLPNVLRATEPWLREKVVGSRFWDGKHDPSHTGEYDLPEPTESDRQAMFQRFMALPSPFLAPPEKRIKRNSLPIRQ